MTITEIKLTSPFHVDLTATFNCHFNNLINDEALDILRIIRFLSHDLPSLSAVLIENSHAVKSFDDMKKLINDYNKWIEENNCLIQEYKQSTSYKQSSNDLVKYLMILIYNRTVLDPDKLNHYEPFSPQVYGETSYDLIDELLKRVNLIENDIFMDLGSGVGNVVLHVAALAKCKHCYGFEKAEWPAFYASKMEKEFKFWMKFFDKSYSNFSLYRADFLSDEEYIDENKTKTMNEYVQEIINDANLIFVNNYAFGAEIDHKLKQRFCNMTEGALIVSSKPFCSLNFRINSRNLNDIGTMLNIDFEPLNGHVSWTDRPINYYFHKIDRTLLEKYFESKKNNHNDNNDKNKHIKSPSSNSSSSTSSSLSLSESSSSPSSSTSTSSSDSDTKSKKKPGRKPKLDEEKQRGRKKTKKRKQSPHTSFQHNNNNTHHSSSSTSLIAKKRAKLNKKIDLSKSLNKEQLNTLNKMHEITSKTITCNTITNNNKTNSINFNNLTMTSLRDENLSNKLLKDCKISPKLLNTKQQKKIQSDSSSLGNDVNEAIDNYLKKLKKQFVNYLMFMKTSSDFQANVRNEINAETNKKSEYLIKIEKLEKKTTDLLREDVALLKSRAEEVGINNLNSPSQLMDHAKQMLDKHHQLLERMNSLQNHINMLESKQTNNNVKSNNALLNMNNTRLQNTFESLKKLANYFNVDQRINLSNLIKQTTDECFNNKNNINNHQKSEPSDRSTDGTTLTATDHVDDEQQQRQQQMMEYDDTNDYEDPKESNHKSIKQQNNKQKQKTVNQQQPFQSYISSCINTNIKYDKILDQDTTNKNWGSFKIPKKTNQSEDNSNSSPTTSSTNKHQGPHTPPGSPSSLLHIMNQSNSVVIHTEAKKYSSLNENSTNNNQMCSNYESSLNLNSLNHNQQLPQQQSICNNNNNNNNNSKQTYPNYYHPKKKYMMENFENSANDFKKF